MSDAITINQAAFDVQRALRENNVTLTYQDEAIIHRIIGDHFTAKPSGGINDLTLRDFFAMAARVGEASRVIRDAQAMLGGRIDTSPTNAQLANLAEAEGHHGIAATLRVQYPPRDLGVLRSTPQPNPLAGDVPEGLISPGKTGVEILAERQREEIARRTGVVLDPKLGIVDAEAQAVKARLKLDREQAEREALAKLSPEQRKEFES